MGSLRPVVSVHSSASPADAAPAAAGAPAPPTLPRELSQETLGTPRVRTPREYTPSRREIKDRITDCLPRSHPEIASASISPFYPALDASSTDADALFWSLTSQLHRAIPYCREHDCLIAGRCALKSLLYSIISLTMTAMIDPSMPPELSGETGFEMDAYRVHVFRALCNNRNMAGYVSMIHGFIRLITRNALLNSGEIFIDWLPWLIAVDDVAVMYRELEGSYEARCEHMQDTFAPLVAQYDAWKIKPRAIMPITHAVPNQETVRRYSGWSQADDVLTRMPPLEPIPSVLTPAQCER